MAQLVSLPPAVVSIEEPGGARDLPQFNTHSAHNSTLSDVMGRVIFVQMRRGEGKGQGSPQEPYNQARRTLPGLVSGHWRSKVERVPPAPALSLPPNRLSPDH